MYTKVNPIRIRTYGILFALIRYVVCGTSCTLRKDNRIKYKVYYGVNIYVHEINFILWFGVITSIREYKRKGRVPFIALYFFL
jgi:hypothetical protein